MEQIGSLNVSARIRVRARMYYSLQHMVVPKVRDHYTRGWCLDTGELMNFYVLALSLW